MVVGETERWPVWLQRGGRGSGGRCRRQRLEDAINALAEGSAFLLSGAI